MADIRLSRPAGSTAPIWVAALIGVALLVWGTASFLGDPSDDTPPRVGAAANFGGERAAVIPMQPAAFASLVPLGEEDLGRLLRIRGTVASPVRGNTLWLLTPGGYRLLVRFEPAPPEGALARFAAGSTLELNGYLDRISAAEFKVWADSLGLSLPQPPPGRKFGALPDPEFQRRDAFYIRGYYVSVRPEAIADGEEGSRAA
ncbi:hypothetical protein BH23GEM4_BH23GEM4_13450 [soil metagenome]